MRPVRPSGHPLHPAAVHVPMGLWLTVPAWDALAAATGREVFHSTAFWCVTGGLAGAAVAIATGLLEAPFVPRGPAAERSLERHWMLALSATAAFAASALLRRLAPSAPWGMLSSGVGAALLAAAGWHGGELSLKHGAGRGP